MNKFNLLLVLVFSYSTALSQNPYNDLPFSTRIIDDPLSKKSTSVTATTGPVDLTGNYKILSIMIGFPDRTFSIPHFYESSTGAPQLGTFPNGTLLNDKLPYLKHRWYEEQAENFFKIMSSDKFNIDVEYVFQPGGGSQIYISNTSMGGSGGWIDQNNSSTNVILRKWDDIAQDIANQIFNDDPTTFDNVTFVEFIFLGVTNQEFYEDGSEYPYAFTSSGGKYTITAPNPDVDVKILAQN